MANNANIKMVVKQTADGATDSSELFTRGEFREHAGSYFIDTTRAKPPALTAAMCSCA